VAPCGWLGVEEVAGRWLMVAGDGEAEGEHVGVDALVTRRDSAHEGDPAAPSRSGGERQSE
jgi:hypothetical protein